jgi:hypothetical protein
LQTPGASCQACNAGDSSSVQDSVQLAADSVEIYNDDSADCQFNGGGSGYGGDYPDASGTETSYATPDCSGAPVSSSTFTASVNWLVNVSLGTDPAGRCCWIVQYDLPNSAGAHACYPAPGYKYTGDDPRGSYTDGSVIS